MYSWQFFNNPVPDISGLVEKLSKIYINVLFFSKPGDKVLIIGEILWSQNLTVWHH